MTPELKRILRAIHQFQVVGITGEDREAMVRAGIDGDVARDIAIYGKGRVEDELQAALDAYVDKRVLEVLRELSYRPVSRSE